MIWTVSVTHSRILNLVPNRKAFSFSFFIFLFLKSSSDSFRHFFLKICKYYHRAYVTHYMQGAYIYLRISSRGEKEMFMFVCCIFGGRWKNIFWKLFDRKLGDIEKVHEVAFSSMWKYIFYFESINALFSKKFHCYNGVHSSEKKGSWST